MFRVFEDTTPLVEGLSIDEAFLDTRGMERLAGSPVEIAARLRRDVRERVGLPITVGVARTKFLAKVASAVAKPDGLLVVPPDREPAFLHPLPVERLWGVGPVTAGRFHRIGSRRSPRLRVPGNRPRDDRRPGCGPPPARARAQSRSAARGAAPPAAVDRLPAGRSREIGRGGRRGPRRARRSRDTADADRRPRRADGRAAPALRRLHACDPLVDDAAAHRRVADDPRDAAGVVAAATEIRRRGLTLSASVTNLDDERTLQLELPFWEPGWTALDAALDEVRNRYGADAVKRGVLLGRNAGITMPLLPD